MAQTKINLKPFRTPNHVLIERPPRPRQEGINFDSGSIPLSELDVDTLDELCREFRENIFQKAGKEDPKS